MLAEDQLAPGVQHPSHLSERRLRIGNRAQCIRHDDRIDAPALERNVVCRYLEKLNIEWDRASGVLRELQHLGRRIESPALLNAVRILVLEVQS